MERNRCAALNSLVPTKERVHASVESGQQLLEQSGQPLRGHPSVCTAQPWLVASAIQTRDHHTLRQIVSTVAQGPRPNKLHHASIPCSRPDRRCREGSSRFIGRQGSLRHPGVRIRLQISGGAHPALRAESGHSSSVPDDIGPRASRPSHVSRRRKPCVVGRGGPPGRCVYLDGMPFRTHRSRLTGNRDGPTRVDA